MIRSLLAHSQQGTGTPVELIERAETQSGVFPSGRPPPAIITVSTLLSFEPLDFTLEYLADECRPSLRPDQLFDALAKTFRQTNVGRFHVERWPSHAAS